MAVVEEPPALPQEVDTYLNRLGKSAAHEHHASDHEDGAPGGSGQRSHKLHLRAFKAHHRAQLQASQEDNQQDVCA